MEEGMKALNIAAKVLAWRSNAMWSILLAIGEAAKALAGNVLTTKSLRLLSVYIGTRKTRCPRASLRTIGGGGFFFEYGPAEEISTVRSKSGIATRDVELMVTLTRNRFNEVPKVITCGGQNICVVVRGAMPSFVFAVPRVTLRNCARKKSGTAVSTIDNGAAHGRSA